MAYRPSQSMAQTVSQPCPLGLLLPKQFFVELQPQWRLLCVETWKFPKHMHNCHVPWHGFLACFFAAWWLVQLSVSAPYLCDLGFLFHVWKWFVFNLLSKPYFPVFNQYQGGKLKWLRIIPVTTVTLQTHLLDNKDCSLMDHTTGN